MNEKEIKKVINKIPPLYGISEFGDMVGWPRNKVSVYFSRGKLPEPATYANSRPLWIKEQIELWKNQNDIKLQ